MAARSSSPGLSSTLRFTVLLIVADLSCFCASNPNVTCSIPSVEKGEMATLTCDFGSDMQQVQAFIIVEHTPRQMETEEEILGCSWIDGGYNCTVYLPQVSFCNAISQRLTIYLPEADETTEGTYYCRAEQYGTPFPCDFSLKAVDPVVVDATVASMPEKGNDKTYGVNVWLVVCVILIGLIVLVGGAGGVVWCCFPNMARNGLEIAILKLPKRTYTPVNKVKDPEDNGSLNQIETTDRNSGATTATTTAGAATTTTTGAATTTTTGAATTTTTAGAATTTTTAGAATTSTTKGQSSGKRLSDRSSGGTSPDKKPSGQPPRDSTVEKKSSDKPSDDVAGRAEFAKGRAKPVSIRVTPYQVEETGSPRT